MKPVFKRMLFILCIGLAAGCDRTPAINPSGKTIKIGVLAPFSGPDRTKGIDGVKGMERAMRFRPLLDNGDRVILVKADDKNDPTLSVQVLKNLADKEKVSAVITFSGSGPVLALAKTADAVRVPILAVVATHPDTTKDNRFISQLCFDDHVQGTIAALFVRDELLLDRAAVFSNPKSAYSTYLASAFETKFRSIGGEITDRVLLTGDDGTLAETIETLKAKDPELLYLPVGTQAIIRMAGEIRKHHWKPKMMTTDGFMATMLAQHEEHLGLVSDMLTTDFFADDMPLSPFGKRMNYQHHRLKTSYTALGMEGYALLVDAMNRCGDPGDRERLNSQIRATSNFMGVAGRITIRSDGRAERPLAIASFAHGRSRIIARVY